MSYNYPDRNDTACVIHISPDEDELVARAAFIEKACWAELSDWSRSWSRVWSQILLVGLERSQVEAEEPQGGCLGGAKALVSGM